jgi:hypothetical protein
VLATRLSPDAESFLQVGDRCGEVGGGVDEVVKQHVNLNSVQGQIETALWRWCGLEPIMLTEC